LEIEEKNNKEKKNNRDYSKEGKRSQVRKIRS